MPSRPSDTALRVALGRYRVYAATAFSYAWVPVMYTAFVLDRGFSGAQYAQLWATYYVAMVLAELPWGWVADRFGHHRLLIAGPFVLAVSFLVLGHGTHFETCLVGMVMAAAGHAMISGADSSYLYELLADHGCAADALHEESVTHRWRLFGVSLADLAGGFVAWGFGTTRAFDLAAVIMLVCGFSACGLPAAGLARTARPAWRRAVAAVRHPGVGWVLAWYAVVFVLLRVGFQLYQPTLVDEGIEDLRWHGGLLAALNVVAGLGAWMVMPAYRRLAERGTATLVLVLMAASFAGLAGLGAVGGASAFLVVTALCSLQQMSFAFLQPLGRTALNQRIPSTERASLLSVQSMLARLVFGIVLLLIPLDDVFQGGLPGAYLILAVVGALAALVFHVAHGRIRAAA